MANRSAGSSVSSTIGLPPRFITSAVVIIADLMAAGDQYGWELLSKAAMPLRERPCCYNAHTRADYVWFENSWGLHAGASRGEGSNCWRRRVPNDSSFKHDSCCGREG